jgi:ribosomal protein L40E
MTYPSAMRCSQCGGEDLAPPRRVELTKEVGTIGLYALDRRGDRVLEDIRATVCRTCGAVHFSVPVEGRDWSG